MRSGSTEELDSQPRAPSGETAAWVSAISVDARSEGHGFVPGPRTSASSFPVGHARRSITSNKDETLPSLTKHDDVAYSRNYAYKRVMLKRSSRPNRRSHESPEALRKFKADVFRVLANPKRIHIVECLSDGELSVKSIQKRVGIELPAVSQHLAVLRAKRLVTWRKDRNQVFYALRDPLLTEVLGTMRLYFHAHIDDAMKVLRALRSR